MFLDKIRVIILLCILSASEQNQAEQQADQPPAHEGETQSQQQLEKDSSNTANVAKDPRKLVKDAQHIKDHLKIEYGFNDEQAEKYLKQYDAQTQFFLMHDYDNNTKLDGLELLKSMTHHHDDSEDEHHGNGDETETLTEFVDMVMRDQDINDDGFIDYPEYISYYTKFDKDVSDENSPQSP